MSVFFLSLQAFIEGSHSVGDLLGAGEVLRETSEKWAGEIIRREKKEVQVLESSGCRMAKHNLQSGYTGKSTSMTHGKITVTSPCVQAAQNRIGQDDLGVEQDL